MFNDFKKLSFDITKQKILRLKDIFDRLNLSNLEKRLLTLSSQLDIINTTSPIQISTGNAYIIVHAHNPEGLEIGGLVPIYQGPIIYFDNIFIGYAPRTKEEQEIPKLITPGTYNVYAIFNGIQVDLGQQSFLTETTTTLTFNFVNRTEISTNFIYFQDDIEAELDAHPFPFSEVTVVGIEHTLHLHGTPDPDGVKYTASFNFSISNASFHRELRGFRGYNDINKPDGWLVGQAQIDYINSRPTISISFPFIENAFTYYYSQYTTSSYYPSISIYNSFENQPYGLVGGTGSPNSGITILPANINYNRMIITPFDLLGPPPDYQLMVSIFNNRPPTVKKMNEFVTNFHLSSIPYDITGSGF